MWTLRVVRLPLVVLNLFLLSAVAAAGGEEPFTVRFQVSNLDNESPSEVHDFYVEVHPEWAPLGAAHFKELVQDGYYTDLRFFRVIKGFMAQFGMHGNPDINRKYGNSKIPDDPPVQSNTRGYLTFATSGPNSRTTQLFINFGKNSYLDKSGFAPFGVVVGNGMEIVDRIYNGYGEGAPGGRGPSQGRIGQSGNAFLDADFPKLSRIVTVELVGDSGANVLEKESMEDLTKLALRKAIH